MKLSFSYIGFYFLFNFCILLLLLFLNEIVFFIYRILFPFLFLHFAVVAVFTVELLIMMMLLFLAFLRRLERSSIENW